jgi:transcriptional regulator with XRE-family HTH domain
MNTNAILSTEELENLQRLGSRVRLARLRRNLTQVELAERMGVHRLSVVNLEKGSPGISFALVTKALYVFGYVGRIGDLLAVDEIGEEMELATGRQRASTRTGVAHF